MVHWKTREEKRGRKVIGNILHHLGSKFALQIKPTQTHTHTHMRARGQSLSLTRAHAETEREREREIASFFSTQLLGFFDK